MSINEFLKRQESINKMIQRAMQPSFDIQRITRQICNSSPVIRGLSDQMNVVSMLSSRLEEIARFQQGGLLRAIELPHSDLAQIVQSQIRLSSAASASATIANLMVNSASNRILNSVSAAVAVAQPYISVEQYEEYTETIEPVLNQGLEKRLTVGDCLALISLLLTIWFGIVSNLPDAQLDRIIQQNDTLTVQQEELIELEKNNIELRDALNALTDSINLLSDEVDALRSEIEDSNDISESNSQPDPENSQNQNSDSQN